MKRFFTSMLGALAAIWISVILIGILGVLTVFGIISLATRGASVPEIKDKAILYLDLATSVKEISTDLDIESMLYGQQESTLLLQPTIEAIRAAETDPRIKGIYINAEGVSGGIASLMDLNKALENFKTNSKKWVVAYGDQITQGSYFVSSVADELYINPQGMLDIHGLSSTVTFYKGLLEKIGIEVQVLKVGTFKSAVEPYILDSISEANRLQMKEYMGNIWYNISSTMASARDLPLDSLNCYADSMLLTVSADTLVTLGLVDKTMYRHEVEDRLRNLIDIPVDKKLPLIGISDYYTAVKDKLTNEGRDKIIVLYAVGEISENGREGITSSRMVPKILELAQDKNIKGMVLRVNSPGGSAYASEQIWEALEQFKATGKKLYVSMGDVAASGGYYISCGGDRIFASPVTLTGSIGIFGLVPNLKGLLNDHLGVTTQSVSTNANGDFPSFTQPMTPFQQASMQRMVDRGYETFVDRCAEGRDISVDSIKTIAEGRVWTGETACGLGLVDELGTLDDAVSTLASDLNLGKYQIEVWPSQRLSVLDALLSIERSISSSVIRKAMGEDAYEIYRKAKRIEETDLLQCRMEEVTLTL